jgi:hypothetical protein
MEWRRKGVIGDVGQDRVYTGDCGLVYSVCSIWRERRNPEVKHVQKTT